MMASCCIRVYLVYQAKGLGLWLIPVAISMAFMILIIPLSVLKHIWNLLGHKREGSSALILDADFTAAWQQCTYNPYT